MDHRAGYMEDVRQLVGEVQSRQWLGDEGAISVAQQDRYVDIILGPDAETLDQVAALLQGPE
jgi:hypothetical protein